MTFPFNRPNSTSTGGAGGGGLGGNSGGSGRITTPIPPRNRPYPWPLPYSATQGCVGGAGGVGAVSVQKNPYYSPFLNTFPSAMQPRGWFSSISLRS